MEAVGISAVTSQGLFLVDSYKSYKIDDGFLSEIREIQSMINKRNVESRFDEAAFKKSQENSKWITEKGKESVIFNPKASANEIIQDLAIYKMSHDLFSQKLKMVKVYIKMYQSKINLIKITKKRTEFEDLYQNIMIEIQKILKIKQMKK